MKIVAIIITHCNILIEEEFRSQNSGVRIKTRRSITRFPRRYRVLAFRVAISRGLGPAQD